MKFTVDYFLNLRWRDRRFDMRNLNEDTTLNKLSYKTISMMWVPQLSFFNALGNLQTTLDRMTSAVVVRGKGNKFRDDFSSAAEGSKET